MGTKITIKDYAPLVFDQLRLASGVTYEEYLVMSPNFLISREVSSIFLQKAWSDSKIGSEEDDDEIIAYSSDRRFVIHRISSDQAKVLANILPTYYMVFRQIRTKHLLTSTAHSLISFSISKPIRNQ